MSIVLIDKKLVALAKTRVARWLDVTGHPSALRSKVLRGVDLISRELPARSDWFELNTVSLDKSAGMDVLIEAKNFRAFQCGDCVAVSTMLPSWARGWSRIFKDEEVYQILTWLLHYARQYIHRSYVASVLMIVWESDQRVLHPFGSRVISSYYGGARPVESAERAFTAAEAGAAREWGPCKRSTENIIPSNSPWLHRNTLDPLLHEAVFHFLRAQNLRTAEFAMESVVAFDCAMQSVVRFVRDRFHCPNEPSRADTLQNLGLPIDRLRAAEYLYFLRNNFGAHAGGWRWWDQAELLEGDVLDDFADLVRLALAAAADLEPKVRLIDPEPSQWAEWLFEHFEMLWEAVWFEKVDEWDRKLSRIVP